MQALDALFYPYTICLNPLTLKSLLLIYDRIFFLPIDNQLNPGHESLSKRWSMQDGILHATFGSESLARRNMMYSSEPAAWDDDMKSLMASYDDLESRGICVGLQDERIASPSARHPLESAVDADLSDQHFVYRTDRYKRDPRTMVEPSELKGHRMKGGGIGLRPPYGGGTRFVFAAMCSERLNTALLFSESAQVVPVSTEPVFIELLNTKVRRLIDSGVLDMSRFSRRRRARFNMLSWNVLTEAAPISAITTKSIDQIVQYREDTQELSMRFREFLITLETGLGEEPWSGKFHDEIMGLIQGHVLPELRRVREAKADIWRKLFHEAISALGTRTVIAASAALSLQLFMAPSTSYMELLAAGLPLGAAATLAEYLPKMFAAREEEIRIRRNGLFFLLNLH
jgi:hypothetical protein